MLRVRAVGLLGALLVSLGCGGTRTSPIEHIRETLAMAENYRKIDEEALGWFEEHPGQRMHLRVSTDVEHDALDLEAETSPHSDEHW